MTCCGVIVTWEEEGVGVTRLVVPSLSICVRVNYMASRLIENKQWPAWHGYPTGLVTDLVTGLTTPKAPLFF